MRYRQFSSAQLRRLMRYYLQRPRQGQWKGFTPVNACINIPPDHGLDIIELDFLVSHRSSTESRSRSLCQHLRHAVRGVDHEWHGPQPIGNHGGDVVGILGNAEVEQHASSRWWWSSSSRVCVWWSRRCRFDEEGPAGDGGEGLERGQVRLDQMAGWELSYRTGSIDDVQVGDGAGWYVGGLTHCWGWVFSLMAL